MQILRIGQSWFGVENVLKRIESPFRQKNDHERLFKNFEQPLHSLKQSGTKKPEFMDPNSELQKSKNRTNIPEAD